MPPVRQQSIISSSTDAIFNRHHDRLILVLMAFVLGMPSIGSAQDALPDEARVPLDRLEPAIEFPPANSTDTLIESDALEGKDRRNWREIRSSVANGLWAGAQDKLDDMLATHPGFVEARITRAQVRARLGDNDGARRDLRAVIKIDPRNVAAHGLLGELSLIDGEPMAAVLSLRLAMAAHPERPQQPERLVAALLLARTLESEGYLTAALELYETFRDQTKEPTRAMRRHERLREMMNANREELERRVAELQSRLGLWEKAAASWKAISDAAPNDYAIWRRLLRAQAQLGDAAAVETSIRAMTQLMQAGSIGESKAVIAPEILEIWESLPATDENNARAIELLIELGDTATMLGRARKALFEGNSSYADTIVNAARRKAPDDIDVRIAAIRQQLRKENYVAAANELTATMAMAADPIGAFDASFDYVSKEALDGLRAALVNGEYQPATPDLRAHIKALLLEKAGEHQDAISMAQAVLQSNKTDSLARAILARAQIGALDWEAAASTCADVDDNMPQAARLTFCRGCIETALGNHNAARSHFRMAVELNPKLADAAFALARLEDRLNEPTIRNHPMVTVLNELIAQIDPTHARAREMLVEYYLLQTAVDRAQRVLQGFATHDVYGAEAERAAALFALRTDRSGDVEKATTRYVEELQRIAERYPRDAVTHHMLARFHSDPNINEFEKALAAVQRALEIDPGFVPSMEVAAAIQTRLLAYTESETSYRNLLKHYPNNDRYLRQLRLLLRDRGAIDEAADLFQRQIAKSDSDDQRDRYTFELITMLQKAGHDERAVKVSKTWLDEKPEDATRRTIYVDSLSRAKKHDEAIRRARACYDEDGEDISKFRLRLALESAERFTEAQQLLLAWLEEDPDAPWINEALIRVCWSAGQWQQAIELAQAAHQASPNQGFEAMLIEAYRYAGDFDDAVALRRREVTDAEAQLRNAGANGWRRADLTTAYLRAQSLLVGELMAVERYGEAARLLRSMIEDELAPSRDGETVFEGFVIQLRNTLSEVYRLDGDIGKCISELELIYEEAPYDAGAANNLGYTLIDSGRDAERAERLIRSSLARDPDIAATLDSMGWVFYKKGEFGKAVDMLTRARYRTDREDPVVFDHLGDACFRLGRMEDAKRHWERAIEICDPTQKPPPPAADRSLYPAIKAKLDALADGDTPKTATVLKAGASTEDD